MKNRCSPEHLHKTGFRPLVSVKHAEIGLFVSDSFKNSAMGSLVFLTILIASFVGAVSCVWQNAEGSFTGVLTNFGILVVGVVLSLLLTSLHEALHLVAFWISGAREVSYKRVGFTFLAHANRFVFKPGEYVFAAVLPFIAITSFLLTGLCFSSGWIDVLLWGIILGHTSSCSGDFGMIAYYHTHRDKDILCYDDCGAETFHFYFKNQN